MKKIMTAFLSIILIVSCFIPTAFAATLGDVDGNGSITATDARKILRYVAGLDTLSLSQQNVGDVDGNGSVTSTDARRILRHVAGLETS